MQAHVWMRVRKPAAIWSIGLLLPLAGCQTTTRYAAAPALAEPAHVQAAGQPVDQVPVTSVSHTPVQTAMAGDPDLMLFGADPGRQVVAQDQPRSVVSLQQHTFTEVGRDFDPDIDAAGKQMVFASTRHTQRPKLYMQGTRGKAVTQLTSGSAGDIQPRFSPDGRKVAFASDRAGQWDIYILDLDTHATIQVTHNEAHELTPSWSPDGKWLAYSRLSPTGSWELWMVSLVDESERCIGPGLLPRWSPDGSQLAFQRPRQRDGMLFSIWTVRIADGEPSWPTEIAAEPDAALICPTWSSDGKQIAYCRVAAAGLTAGLGTATARPNRADIFVVDAEGSGRMRITDGGANFAPCFSNEGRLFFSTDRDGRERIWSLRAGSSARANLADATPISGHGNAAALPPAHQAAVVPAAHEAVVDVVVPAVSHADAGHGAVEVLPASAH